MIFIFVFITIIIVKLLFSQTLNCGVIDNEKLELLWTITPCFILIIIALPSLQVLYYLEDMVDPILTVKIIGHQWYWSYEIVSLEFSESATNHHLDHKKENLNTEFDYNIKLDSYVCQNELFRLLSTDNHLILPYHSVIRGLVTSEDVIHSWALPRLGLKIDANPGRLNIVQIFRTRAGLMYGQCSEICGVNHALIPIKLEFTHYKIFSSWMFNKLNE